MYRCFVELIDFMSIVVALVVEQCSTYQNIVSYIFGSVHAQFIFLSLLFFSLYFRTYDQWNHHLFLRLNQDENGNVALGSLSGSDTDSRDSSISLPDATSTAPNQLTSFTTSIPPTIPHTPDTVGPTSARGTEIPNNSSTNSTDSMMMKKMHHGPKTHTNYQHCWRNYQYSSLSIALLLIPLGVFFYYTSVGAFERLVDSYLVALLGLSD